jgi:hypothetical protein
VLGITLVIVDVAVVASEAGFGASGEFVTLSYQEPSVARLRLMSAALLV